MRIVFSRSALARWCVLALSAVPCGDAAPGAYGVALDRCPYAVLGIRRDSTIAEIRAAYRVQAKATHPDKQQQGDSAQAEDRFLEVVAAFELLSDERERRVYDQTGHRNAQRDAQRETYERRERAAGVGNARERTKRTISLARSYVGVGRETKGWVTARAVQTHTRAGATPRARRGGDGCILRSSARWRA